MTDCLFCRIASKEIESSIVFESDRVLAIEDINPAAPVHVLVIPKEHVASAHDLPDADPALAAEIFAAAASIARARGIDDAYRVVTNVGRDAGQTVFHLHFHVIGGRSMSWPPG